jgi:hypothetical protein
MANVARKRMIMAPRKFELEIDGRGSAGIAASRAIGCKKVYHAAQRRAKVSATCDLAPPGAALSLPER